jgi:tetratricopeptide (TPR) repeat protein
VKHILIDFGSYITDHTRDFTSREWVFKAINDWLASVDGSRSFLLTGKPGSGKTAIVSRLSQFTQGTVLPPDGLTHLAPDFLSAMHFCSARDSRWINPHVFAESLAMQLARRYPTYAKALAEKSGDRQIRIKVDQQVHGGVVDGQVIGVVIESLNVNGVAPDTFFNRVVREPLEALFHDGFAQQVIILVDALDEALLYSEKTNIVSLLAHNEYAPLLGVLSVARKSLTLAQLQAFTNKSESAIWKYLGDLQQFIEEVDPKLELQGEEKGYRLYHQSVVDFLHLQRLVVGKKTLRNTFFLPSREFHCKIGTYYHIKAEEQGWDKVDNYGLLYLTEHLSLAYEWQQLFEILDTVEYGKTTLNFDLTTRAYAQDLDLGRRTATWGSWTVEEGIALLPRLWRYTVLRCSLTSRADQYPLAAFQVLLLLQRESEAQDLAELLTSPAHKANVMLHIAKHLAQQSEWGPESIQMLERIYEVACTIEGRDERAKLLRELGIASAQAQQWEQAEAIARLVEIDQWRVSVLSELGIYLVQARQHEHAKTIWSEALDVVRSRLVDVPRAECLRELGVALVRAQQWDHAEAIWTEALEAARKIVLIEWRAEALEKLGVALNLAQQWDHAEAVLTEALEVVHSIPLKLNEVRAVALLELGIALIQARQWERAKEVGAKAEAVARSIKRSPTRANALSKLATALSHTEQREQAEFLWDEVQTLASTYTIEWGSWLRSSKFCELGITLARAQQWERAEAVINLIETDWQKAEALGELAIALARARQWERVDVVWGKIHTLVHLVERSKRQVEVLSELGATLAHAKQWETAKAVWNEVQVVLQPIVWSAEQVEVLSMLGITLAQAQQWEQAERVWAEALARAHSSKEVDVDRWRTEAWGRWGIALAQAQQWTQAQAVAYKIKDSWWKAKVLRELGATLAQAQQWERAEAAVDSIEDRDERAEALRELGTALAQAQQWERAEAVVSSSDSFTAKADILCKLGTALAQAQQQERAEAVWAYVQDIVRLLREKRFGYDVSLILSELGLALAQAQQWERAEALWTEAEEEANKLSDDWETGEALCELVAALGLAQRWERAETIARSISRSDKRAKALRILVGILSQAQQWERAEVVAHSIEQFYNEERDERARALCELGLALARAHQWEHARAIACIIEKRDKRFKVLREITEVIAKTGDYEELLHAVQSWWMQVDKRDDAIQLLPLATQLILFEPEIGSAFCNVFTWVDNFIKVAVTGE